MKKAPSSKEYIIQEGAFFYLLINKLSKHEANNLSGSEDYNQHVFE